MFTINVSGRELGPYNAIMHANKNIQGNISPILYDTADITLLDSVASFSLAYKEIKNLSGKNFAFVDVINMHDGTFFSLQVSNIYYFGVFEGIPHIIAKVGDELIYFENFGKNKKPIEADGDKTELTPIGAFDMFLSYDNNYFYPLIFSRETKKIAKVSRFYDYYGWMSYTDANGGKHFVMLIEDERSTEKNPHWYFVDNFVPVSENLIFPDDEYVENWKLDAYGNILFDVTSGKKYHIDRDTGRVRGGWDALPTSKNFTYIREFDDTDADEIVAKNEKGFFIINRHKNILTEAEQKNIIYFQRFVWCLSPSEADRDYPCFLMQKSDGQIVLVNNKSEIMCGTELLWEYEYKSISISGDILRVELLDGQIFEIIL